MAKKSNVTELPKVVQVKMRVDITPDTPNYYVNFAEVSQTPHDFCLAVARIPSKISTSHQQELKASGVISIDPTLTLTLPPTLLHGFLLTKSEKYYFDAEAIKEPAVTKEGRPGGVVRDRVYEYDSKQAAMGRARGGAETPEPSNRNKRSVWTVTTKPFKGAHFATFPPDLIEPCILAGTSERGRCPHCGAPWKRVVEKGAPDLEHQIACGGNASWKGSTFTKGKTAEHQGNRAQSEESRSAAKYGPGGYAGEPTKDYAAAGAQDASATKARILAGMVTKITTGWLPTCKCPAHEPVPCVVLDPFAGAGTTGLVAQRHGRQALLIELNPEYVGLMETRLKNG